MRRRDVMRAVAGISGMAVAHPIMGSGCSEGSPKDRVNVVLVHGAGHGGWCWGPVADQLAERGYRVFRPTLTGLGERAHLRSPDISLDTHIDDIVNLIIAEEMQNVCLVAHSYGGTVITGVCDQIKERVRLAVFLDANTPGEGEATIPNLSRAAVEEMTGEPLLEGYLLPVMDPVTLGIDPQDAEMTEWVRRRLTEQPIQTVAEPIHLQSGGTDGLARSFILTTPLQDLREWQRAKVAAIKADPTWDFRELLVGHDAMIISPCETAQLLDTIIADHLGKD
jgi:pimeloyl-ACP methyl ester carboxylesterase